MADQQIAGESQILQAGNTQDAEQDQVINIHKITQCADDDDWLEDFAQDGRAV